MAVLKAGCFLVSLGLCVTGILCGGKDGHCVWYGQCGLDIVTKKPVNCVYNGTARPFQSPQALGLLKQYCPDLYQGAGTKTCCSDDQLQTLVDNMVVPVRYLGRCPSCLHNFLNIYCYLTCHPQHSRFLSLARTTPWVHPETGQKELQVNEVEYTVSKDFAVGMFNSCRQVLLPSGTEPAISVLCGHPADECTPQNWLDYMGNTQNQNTPFQIDFNITDQTYVNAKGELIRPQNASILPCKPTHTYDRPPCLCGQPGKRVPFDKHFPLVYRTEQLIITRTGNHSKIPHKDPPPATSTTVFNPIFDKEFLHQVLALQDKLYALQASYKDKAIVLQDICFRLHHTDCTILSILNYFQNNATTLDKVVMDSWGFFTLADYLDHFMSCVKIPESQSDLIAFNDSCLGTDGGPVYPWTALRGFDGGGSGENYQNSTGLVITFIVNYDDNEYAEKAKVHAWEEAAMQFLHEYTQHQPNMTLAFASHTHHRTHPAESAPVIG